jgi:hypothetical protein
VNQPEKPFLLEKLEAPALLAGLEKLDRKPLPYHKSACEQKQAHAVPKKQRSPCRTT